MALKIYADNQDILFQFLERENLMNDFKHEVAVFNNLKHYEILPFLNKSLENISMLEMEKIFTDGILIELDNEGYSEDNTNWFAIQEDLNEILYNF